MYDFLGGGGDFGMKKVLEMMVHKSFIHNHQQRRREVSSILTMNRGERRMVEQYHHWRGGSKFGFSV
jgi:hypothetical protein